MGSVTILPHSIHCEHFRKGRKWNGLRWNASVVRLFPSECPLPPASDPSPLGSSSPLPFEISPTDRALRECHPLLLSFASRDVSAAHISFLLHMRLGREGGREASRTDPEVSPQLRGAPQRAPCGISGDDGGRRERKVKSEIAGEEEGEDQRRGSGVGMKARKSLLLSVCLPLPI